VGEVCKGLTVSVYFYSHCRYITTVAPFVHLYARMVEMHEWCNSSDVTTVGIKIN